MSKSKKGSNASGAFQKKAGRGTAQTQPPKPTHYRCRTCYSRVKIGEDCYQNHEKLRFNNAVETVGDASVKHGIPVTHETLVKLRKAFYRGDHAYCVRVRPN